MKIWTYLEASNKVLIDLKLQDETFITPVELVGYFNEAVEAAQSEINTLTMAPDYFLSSSWVNVQQGQDIFPLPGNIYADKVRNLIYQNGAIIYAIPKMRKRYEFENIAYIQQYGASDDYQYELVNHAAGQIRINMFPASRETAVLPPPLPYPESADPIAGIFTPVRIWYTRTSQRLPIPTYDNVQGEKLPRESLVPASIDIALDTISTVCGSYRNDGVTEYVPGGVYYVTGDILYLASTGVLPAPLVRGTPYYVIATGVPGVIQLATTLANALANVPIDLTTQGTGYHQVSVVTTQNILNNLYIDIPQFAMFVNQWVKCRCLSAEPDPRLADESIVLKELQEKMVSTLATMIADMEDQVEMDFSTYQEMS